MRRAELILDNLIIQIANAAIQPLLNHFADVEEVKHKFYRYNLIATREIERFRNDLSWKYRLEKYVSDPQLIFESRHVLFALSNPAIRKLTIYAPRTQELQQLEGVQLAITLVLELQDAIAPRLKSAITFLGNGFSIIAIRICIARLAMKNKKELRFFWIIILRFESIKMQVILARLNGNFTRTLCNRLESCTSISCANH